MLVGIGGVSRSGKSTLAHSLVNTLRAMDYQAIVLNQDNYVKHSHLIPKIKDKIDWENPESIDLPLLLEVTAFYLSKFEIVILDGFLVYHFDELNTLYDKKIFLEIDKDTFFERKRADRRWGPIPDWYIAYIWEAYEKFGQIPEQWTGVLQLSGENFSEFEKVVDYLDIKPK
ncbi:AAA family ATPase [Marinilongibacter aquaticus]|uniref:AAA family ATPase n=1 Tax=Marinilongibacter aquaticus TaxID=2975157 RepID=UPI0021BD35D9|nr:AAA family ATPase [Marinilongibacter aquaticus]UBM58444.1 AAA family ATPase [Marinilongibacter aquaticus]